MLAGGAGSRFWPASRRARPKQFVPLLGGATPLGATLARLARLAPPRRTWVVTSRDLGPLTRRALRGHPGVRVLLEPEARNTAPAVAWVAARVAALRDGGLLGVFPADHHIPQPGRFARDVRAAEDAAADGARIVLIGVPPTRPDTAYGYLRVDAGAPGAAVRVRRFVEKPDERRARRYLRSGSYLWNAGMLIATPERLLRETEERAPEIWGPLGPSLRALADGRRVAGARLDRAYRRAAPISFDYAVLERSSRVSAVRASFQWSDLGSWDALAEYLPRVSGNRVSGTRPVVALESGGNVIWNTTDKAMVLLGVSDLVVVETEDALLVCRKEAAQDVRRIAGELVRRGRGELA